MADRDELRDRLDDYVTIGGTISISGDVKAGANEMLKMGVFTAPGGQIAGKDRPSNPSVFAILSDEGASLGSQGAAPLPLQYFLAGIAF